LLLFETTPGQSSIDLTCQVSGDRKVSFSGQKYLGAITKNEQVGKIVFWFTGSFTLPLSPVNCRAKTSCGQGDAPQIRLYKISDA
jgi:hypothetical protein